MQWTDVSEEARDWLELLGYFTPTAHVGNRELKGCVRSDHGEDGRVYLDSGDLRNIAAAMTEAADWLDKRAAAEVPAVGGA